MAKLKAAKKLYTGIGPKAEQINVKIAKDLGFSGKKITTIPIPKSKIDWRHKKATKYKQTYEVQKGTPAKQDKIAEETRMVVHDLSERLGFSADKLNDVQYGKIYDLMKKFGHKDSTYGRPFAKEKVNGGFKNLNIFGKHTGFGTPQRLSSTGEEVSKTERDARKQFTQFFKRGYEVEDLATSPLARYQKRFGPEAYYNMRQPFIDLQMKSKDLSKKYQDELFDVLQGEDALARFHPEEYIKFLDAGKDLKRLFQIDRDAARKISNFMNQFKMSVAHTFPADFVKTQKGQGIESLATRFMSKPEENLYIHPGYLNYKLSPHEHNAALKYQAGVDPRKTVEAESIEQLGGYMKFPSGEEIGMHPLQKYGDYDTAIEEAIELIRKNQWMKAGKPPYYAKGGKVKKLTNKLLGSTEFNPSRRKFLKQSGAAAAYTALPTKTLAALAPKAAIQAATRMAPPWIKSMVGVLDKLSGPKGSDSLFMGNGTHIKNFGKQGNMRSFEVTNSDGYKVPVNMIKEKNGDLHIEFDIRDDFANNQHIYMNKKTGTVEIVDENYYMTSPEDYAKDDPLTWDVTTPTQMQEFERKMGLMRGDGSDYIKDYMSTPEGGDYSDLFESFIDSFSPAGNIFHTKANAKKLELKKLQKKEADEMNWEEQFRGGQGIHGYYRGGTSMKDYPQTKQTNVQIKSKPLDRSKIMDAIRIQETGGETNPNRAISYNTRGDPVAYGPYQIKPQTAADAGFGVTKWPTFLQEFNAQGPDFAKKSRAWAREYIDAMYKKFGDDRRAISAYMWGPGNVSKVGNPHRDFWNLDYYDSVMGHYNQGGIARRPNAVPPEKGPDPYATKLTQAVNQIHRRPDQFMGAKFIRGLAKGGFVKRNAPKVLGQPTQYKPLITGKTNAGPDLARVRTDLYTPPEGPYSITNDSGARILDKDFKTLEEAQAALKELATLRTSDASTFKIFGKRPPKTAEGVSEGAPEVNLGMVGKEIPPEQPGAMFWGSREKIIGAPSEAMTGTQWLDYMKRGKHGILNPKGYPIIKDMELNDTSLAPFLSRVGNNILSKEKLVSEFDEMAPKFEAIALGEKVDTRLLSDIENTVKTMDTQAIRNPAIKGFYDYMKEVVPQIREDLGKTNPTQIEFFSKKIDDLVERNFGVKNVLDQGVPQRFPFEIKEIIQQLSQAFGKRTSGFKKYKKRPVHRGTQTMDGGDNYREFLFKSQPGKLRLEEPEYTYAHDFGINESERVGGLVHSRTTDRTDQFGRRLLHIEEIQSDMHQLVNSAARKLKKKHTKWAEEKTTPENEYAKMNTRERKEYDDLVAAGKYAPRSDLKKEAIDKTNEQHLSLILSKIEDLLVQPQTKATQIRLARLNKERAKVRKIIADKRWEATAGQHSGVPQGPLSKTEDYNEFVMKYMLKVAREGGYDGISINTAAVKNKSLSPGSKDYKGNLVAYGPMAEGAMKKAAKKSNANFMKTAIMDGRKRAWEVPTIVFKDNDIAIKTIDKGLPLYNKGGRVKK